MNDSQCEQIENEKEKEETEAAAPLVPVSVQNFLHIECTDVKLILIDSSNPRVERVERQISKFPKMLENSYEAQKEFHHFHTLNFVFD